MARKRKQAAQAASGARGRVSATWLLVAAVTSAALAVGGCALWLPDREPALLGAAGEVTSAPAGVQEYSGSTQMTMVPTLSTERELVGNATGTVTADWSGDGLTSGRRAYGVDGRPVVALATASPMYRDLKTGDKGDDVLALNNELSRIGYTASAGSNTFTWYTGRGVAQLLKDNGGTADVADDGAVTLRLSDILWLPSASMGVPGEWSAVAGSPVTAGSPVGKVTGTITKLSLKNAQPMDIDRTVTIIDQSTTLKAGTTEITDAEFCAKVAATPAVKAMNAEMMAAGIDVQVQLAKPVQALRVPAAAVFGISGSTGCIVPLNGAGKGKPVKVGVVGSELGASLVSGADGADVSSVTRVEIGSRLDSLQCR
ncbi:hypothetical protein [Bifidobacterium leontopitheci]|uniref:Peptidoglycan-binding domain 1 protein n=1 Tax=Bifidobacterium leontopitheci TaxID=2650774 RepID=A0A6I1GPQ0_9BIFI|nr:hypothetical protein [Bifidobacterium leontopitheci]KAB7791486.1 hypothetical protein F7D09_0161 [Bifidobacterium leontopitheci]